MVNTFHTQNLYKFDEVTSAFQKEVRRGNLLPALFWGGELENSGYGTALYNRIFTIMTEDISIGAPTLCIPLFKLYNEWLVCEDPEQKSELSIRVITILVQAYKNRVVNNALLYVSSFTKPPETLASAPISEKTNQIIQHQFQFDLFAGTDNRFLDTKSALIQLARAVENKQVLNALFFANLLHMHWDCGDNRALLAGLLKKKLTKTSKKLATNASMYSWYLLLTMSSQIPALQPSIETLYILYIKDIGTPRLHLMMAVYLLTQYDQYDLSLAKMPVTESVTSAQKEVFCNPLADIRQRRQFAIPTYALDKHTSRGKGDKKVPNNIHLLHQQGEKAGIATRQWSLEQIAKSHGAFRQFAESLQAQSKVHSRMSHFFDVGAVITNLREGIQGEDPYFLKARKFYLAIEKKYGYRMAKSTQIIAKMFPLLLKNQQFWQC